MPHLDLSKNGRQGRILVFCLVFVMASGLLVAGMPRYGDKATSDRGIKPFVPTRVSLNKFEVYRVRDVVSIEWRSGYELDNLGYNVYREVNGIRVQINPSLIAGSALQSGQNVPLTAGNSYSWRGKSTDADQGNETRYWLESIDINGSSTWYGPVFIKLGDDSKLSRTQSKLLADYSREPASPVQFERPASMNEVSGMEMITDLDQQWEIAAQAAVKLSVDRNGWQRVSRAELLGAGLNPSANLANLKLYRDGVEQAIVVNTDGSIEFFGESTDTLYSNTRVYWLVGSNSHGKRVISSSTGPFDPNVQPSSFPNTVERKDRTIRFPALTNGPLGNFFGPSISATSLKQTLQVTGLDLSGAQAQLEVGVQGLSLQTHQVRVQINGSDVGFINFVNRENAVMQFGVSPVQLRENKNIVTLTGVAPGSDVSLIDFVKLTYPRLYSAASNRLAFSVPAGQAAKVGGFTSSNIRVLDVTDTANITALVVSPQADSGGFAFTLPSIASARTLIAFTNGSFDHPKLITSNQPSSWHQASNGTDLLIITHGSFRQNLTPLRTLRESQGLQVAIVDVEDVYDEFSYGVHSAQALKDFMQRARTQWQTPPDYLLLVGDGTADPRDYLSLGSVDFVPAIMVDGVFSEAPSDDSFADLDGDGIGDVPVGRLPVSTTNEAALVVDKIIRYEQAAPGDIQQRGAVMVSDLTDASYNFEQFTLEVRQSLPPTMAVQFINRSAADNTTIHDQIIAAVNLGPGIVNYLGHGSVGVWSGGPILSTPDPVNFTNSQRLSIFVMMTCQNGAFTEVGTDSLAEAIIKAQNGGAVAIWASSGLTVPFGQVAISKQFYELLFSGQALRFGDAAKTAKLATVDMDIRRLSVFFGDPTLRFR